MEKPTWTSLLFKYFLHGILFSGFFLVLGIVWAVILAVLIVVGLFIGLIIGIIVLLFIIGGLNVILTTAIWHISVKSDWKSLLVHGFVLFIVLLLVNSPSFIIKIIAPDWIISIVVFLIYCFIDGFASKKVASYWEENVNPEETV